MGEPPETMGATERGNKTMIVIHHPGIDMQDWTYQDCTRRTTRGKDYITGFPFELIPVMDYITGFPSKLRSHHIRAQSKGHCLQFRPAFKEPTIPDCPAEFPQRWVFVSVFAQPILFERCSSV